MTLLLMKTAVLLIQHDKIHLSYRKDIDGLRGLAVLSVILFHAFPNFFPGGFVGVDIFFVISGYLITSIILDGINHSEFSIFNFFHRRIKRIFPALILILIAVFTAGWFILSPEEYKNLGQHISGSAAFITNFLFWKESGYFDGQASTKALWHLWSLSLEEQFYILWPVLLLAAGVKKFRRVILLTSLIVISFIICIYLSNTNSIAAFYSPLSRFWEILSGAVLVFIPKVKESKNADIISASSLIYIALAFCFINQELIFPGWITLLPVFGAALIIYAGENAVINRSLLSNNFLVWTGLISYPLYLWHWPLLSFYKLALTPNFYLTFFIIILSFFLAWLTYNFLEQPIRRSSKKFISIILLVLMLFCAIAGLYIKRSNGFESRIPSIFKNMISSEAHMKIAMKEWQENKCYLNPGQSFEAYSECLPMGNTKALETIVLWGDSHAAHLSQGFVKTYGEKNKILLRSSSACPPLYGTPKPNRVYCKKINDHILDFIVQSRPSRVVLAANWSEHEWTHVQKTIEALRQNGITNIDLIGPVPYWPSGLPQQMFLEYKRGKTLLPPTRIKNGIKPLIFNLDEAMRDFSHELAVNYISPIKLLCNEEGCLTLTNNNLITFDYSHLTKEGSEFLVSNFKN